MTFLTLIEQQETHGKVIWAGKRQLKYFSSKSRLTCYMPQRATFYQNLKAFRIFNSSHFASGALTKRLELHFKFSLAHRSTAPTGDPASERGWGASRRSGDPHVPEAARTLGLSCRWMTSKRVTCLPSCGLRTACWSAQLKWIAARGFSRVAYQVCRPFDSHTLHRLLQSTARWYRALARS